MQPERIEHIELPSGGWWDVKKAMTHGDRRAIGKAVEVTAIKTLGEFTQAGLDLAKLQGTMGNQRTGLSPEEEDAALLRVSLAWSFSEPITKESIDGRDSQDVQAVLTHIKALYGLDVSETEREAQKKG